MVLLLLLLEACGGDVCPAELAESAEWIARTTEPECAELAEQLNEANELDASELELREQGDQCVAALSEVHDGVSVELECEVSSSGAADCEALVSTLGLECALLLRLR